MEIKRKHLFSFIVFILLALTKIYSQSMQQHLEWESDPNAFEYELEVKGTGKTSFDLHETLTENYYDLKLPAGTYRFMVSVYDYLGKLSDRTEWISFEVIKAYKPQIEDLAYNLTVSEEGENFTVPVKTSEVTKNTKAILKEIDSNKEIPGTIELSKNAAGEGTGSGNNESNEIVFNEVPKGKYKIIVQDPSGYKAESKPLEIVKTTEEAIALAEKNPSVYKIEPGIKKQYEQKKAEEERVMLQKLKEEERKRQEAERIARQEEEERKRQEAERIARQEEEERIRKQKEAEEEAERAAKLEAEEAERLARLEEEERLRKQKDLEEEEMRLAQMEEEERIRLQNEQEEEEKRLRKLAELSKPKKDIYLSSQFGIVYNMVQDSDKKIFKDFYMDKFRYDAGFRLTAVPLKLLWWKFGFDLSLYSTYPSFEISQGAEEGGASDLYEVMFMPMFTQANLIIYQQLVRNKFYLAFKGGVGLTAFLNSVTYIDSLRPQNNSLSMFWNYQFGASSVVYITRSCVFEVGVQYINCMIKEMELGFLDSYMCLGYRF